MTLDPIVHEFTVPCSPERAFEVFTAEMGRWWLPEYTGDAATFTDITIDPHLGGQVTERHADGGEHDWGAVIGWEPGEKVAYTFTLAQDRAFPSVVRATFTPDGDGTAVHFEHGGWDDHNAADRGKFSDWPQLLDRYRALCAGESL